MSQQLLTKTQHTRVFFLGHKNKIKVNKCTGNLFEQFKFCRFIEGDSNKTQHEVLNYLQLNVSITEKKDVLGLGMSN